MTNKQNTDNDDQRAEQDAKRDMRNSGLFEGDDNDDEFNSVVNGQTDFWVLSNELECDNG